MTTTPTHPLNGGLVVSLSFDRSADPTTSQNRYLTGNFACLLVVIAGMAVAPKGNALLVVLPPWERPAAMMDITARTGSAIVDVGSTGRMAILYNERPGTVFSLYRNGAWLVLDAPLISACLGWRIA